MNAHSGSGGGWGGAWPCPLGNIYEKKGNILLSVIPTLKDISDSSDEETKVQGWEAITLDCGRSETRILVF